MSKHRILALDVGEKRIGIAIGDSDVKIAIPSGMIENNSNVVSKIEEIVKNKNIDTIVIGLPRNSDGEETKQSRYVRDFSKKLSELSLPVVFQDESLTSVEAEELLKRQDKLVNQKSRKEGLIDSEAASIILTDYLEANFGY